MKKIIITIASLVCFTGLASAQVAFPSIIEVPASFTGLNPAALRYANNVVGANYAATSGSSQTLANTSYDRTLTGLGVRLVGESMGVGLESQTETTTPDPVGNGIKTTGTNLGGYWAMYDWLSLGLAVENQTTSTAGVSAKENLAGLGVDIKFADIYYLGLVSGPTRVDDGVNTATPITTRYGFGYYDEWNKALDCWTHIEVYVDTLAAHDLGLANVGARTQTGFTFEMIHNTDIDFSINVKATKQANSKDIKENSFLLAWGPDEGLAASLTVGGYDDGEKKFNIKQIGLGWVF